MNAPLTKNETIKRESLYLKGPIERDLADHTTGGVTEESYELLKFHGSYEQFDRDDAERAKKAAAAKGERAEASKKWSFMVRLKIAGGQMTAKQYLALDEVAARYAGTTLRITTRETFQLHWIVKQDLKPVIAEVNHMLLTTMGGCGDVVRNVTCCPAPIMDKKHQRIRADALAISEFTLPKTSAYHEIWVDGENVGRTEENETLEPLYGRTYLPRKFKIGIATPDDNCTDALTNDLAIFPLFEGDTLTGYNLALGGGLGMTHNKPETYPRLASPIAFIGENELLRGVEAVVKLTRDHGDRTNRKHARLKYVVEEKGLEWTFNTLQEYFGAPLSPAKPMPPLKVVDHMGWHEQGDGNLYVGLPILSGRIVDNEHVKIRTGLKTIVERFSPTIHLTADQSMILGGIKPQDKAEIVALLKQHKIVQAEDISAVSRFFVSCVALPTCGLALAEAERVQQPITAIIDQRLAEHNLAKEPIVVRVSGCPNGCSRPYSAEIALVGRMPGHYAFFIGGTFEGTALTSKIFDRVPYQDLSALFDKLFGLFAKTRTPNEAFGDFCKRVSTDTILSSLKTELSSQYKWAA